jgi:hypothetical protein
MFGLGLAAIGAHAVAQTDEAQRYADEIRAAQSAADAARTTLDEAREAGAPLIATHRRLTARLDDRAAALARAQRAAARLAAADRDVPVHLTARRGALTDRLTAAYRANRDADTIARLEAALADVERQIEAAQTEGRPARLLLIQAELEAERLFEEVRALREAHRTAEREADAARSAIDAAQERAAQTSSALQHLQTNARIFLSRSEPPFLQHVTGRASSAVFYEAEWVSAGEPLEEKLRLARYLHADLDRSIARRGEAVDDWIELLQSEQREADRALQAYVSMLGGSSDGFLGLVERGLDAISGGTLGAVVTAGSHTWKKIGVELVDAAASVGQNVGNRVPPHAALMMEAVFQVADVAVRAWKGEDKNPSWSVERLPMASGAIVDSSAAAGAAGEQAIYNSLTAERVRATLDGLHGQLGGALSADDFRERLQAEHGLMTLAAAFSEAAVTARRPDPALFDVEYSAAGAGAWLWGQFTSPSGVVKSLLLENMFSDSPTNMRAASLGLIQSAVRDGLLSRLEAQRLEVWERYIMADLDTRLTAALLRHEGQARRAEIRIRERLANDVIPQLEAELAGQQNRRTLAIARNAQARGRSAELTLNFSTPVTVTEVRLGDEILAFDGRNELWTARFDPRDFPDGEARLDVQAEHAAIAGRALDDPASIASWRPVEAALTGYEPGIDRQHTLTLQPPRGAAFALVMDTSGSMEDEADGRSRITLAKAALSDFLLSGRIRDGEEAALFTFDGCAVRTAAPFTTDLAQVEASVQAAATGSSTPLALSIIAAANQLAERNVERGVLVVVTDGADTCDGAVSEAIAYARAQADELRARRLP